MNYKKEYIGIILDDGSISDEKLQEKVDLFKNNNITKICVATTSRERKHPSLCYSSYINSYIAMLRALRFCSVNYMNNICTDDVGIIVHYGDKPVSAHMLTKMLRMSSVTLKPEIGGIVMVQMQEREATKYNVGFNGCIDKAMTDGEVYKGRGYASMGLLFIKSSIIPKMPTRQPVGEMVSVSDFINWTTTSNDIGIYGLIHSCKKQ